MERLCTAVLGILAGGLLAGCPPAPCRSSAEPSLEIGLGESGFSPLTDPIPYVMGPQGGYHVALAFRVTGLDGEELATADLVGRVDGVERAVGSPWIRLACTGEGLEAAGVLLIFDAGPEVLEGATLDLDVTLRDIDLREVSAQATGVLEYAGETGTGP